MTSVQAPLDLPRPVLGEDALDRHVSLELGNGGQERVKLVGLLQGVCLHPVLDERPVRPQQVALSSTPIRAV